MRPAHPDNEPAGLAPWSADGSQLATLHGWHGLLSWDACWPMDADYDPASFRYTSPAVVVGCAVISRSGEACGGRDDSRAVQESGWLDGWKAGWLEGWLEGWLDAGCWMLDEQDTKKSSSALRTVEQPENNTQMHHGSGLTAARDQLPCVVIRRPSHNGRGDRDFMSLGWLRAQGQGLRELFA